MIKVKDGYAKLIGTTYLGSADRVLLSNGGDIKKEVASTANTLVLRNASGLINSSGFIRTSSSNDYVLLGGGSHCKLTSLDLLTWTSYDTYYSDGNVKKYNWYKIPRPTSSRDYNIYDIQVISDTNYPSIAYYKLWVSKYGATEETNVYLQNLGRGGYSTYDPSEIRLHLYICSDAEGNVYILGVGLFISKMYIKTLKGDIISNTVVGYDMPGVANGFTPDTPIYKDSIAYKGKTIVYDLNKYPHIVTNIYGNAFRNDGNPLVLESSASLYLKSAGSDAASIHLNSVHFKPFDTANGKLNLGTASARWNNIYASGEIQSSGSNAFRLAYGNYGVIHRNDGIQYYILLTNSGEAVTGSFNDLRPFSINLSTGTVSIKQSLRAHKGIYLSNGALHWIEPGYGDSFKIQPYFTGIDDLNYLAILSSVGAEGTNPTPTDKLRILGASGQLQSLVALGIAPFTVTSTTVCPKLNADLLDGYHSDSFIKVKEVSVEQNTDPYTWIKEYALTNGNLKSRVYNSHGTEWAYIINIRDTKNYGTILRTSYAYNNIPRMLLMGLSNGVWSEWNTILHSGNYSSYLGYIGTTPVQASSAALALTGITNATISGLTNTGTLTITNTEQKAHLLFSRGNYNYITAPTGGSIAFCVNGKTSGERVNCDLVISDWVVHSGLNNATSLGEYSFRWSNIYSVFGNFSGRTTTAGLTTSDSIILNGTTSETSLIQFTRTDYNYIAFPTGYSLAFGVGVGSVNTLYRMTDNAFFPETTNVKTLGTSSLKWSTVYATTFSGTSTLVKCTASTANKDRPIVLTDTSNGLHYTTKATINYSTGNIITSGSLYSNTIYVNRAGSSTAGGISLYTSIDPMTFGIAFRGTATYGTHGYVTDSWATYFTMSDDTKRGWIFRRGETNVASISGSGAASFMAVGNHGFIAYPGGGYYDYTGGSITGAIKITLPVSKTSTTMHMTITIYNYTTGTSSTYYVGGYNYYDGDWYNVSAYSIRQGRSNYGNLTVRFGNDGDKDCIYIGETNTKWYYPNIVVSNVSLGHSTARFQHWADGWSVGIVTSFDYISLYVSNPAVNNDLGYVGTTAVLPTSAAQALTGITRISNATNSNLYLGNSNNSGCVCTQDICSHSGHTEWHIYANGKAHFKTHVTIGANLGHSTDGRAELSLVSTEAKPCDLLLGADSVKYWSITARDNSDTSIGGKGLGFYDYVNNTYRMCITQSGNVGIGISSPAGRLDVNGTSYLRGDVTITAVDEDRFLNFLYTGSGTGYDWRIGYLGSGSGDANYFVILSNKTDGTYVNALRIGLTSLAAVFGGTVTAAHFYESSDINLKTNIETITTSDNIPLLKSFDWKSDGSHSYGLIALELEEQGYSELVSDEEGLKTVNYSAALSLIVGKLQVKIRELEKEIESLKNKN